MWRGPGSKRAGGALRRWDGRPAVWLTPRLALRPRPHPTVPAQAREYLHWQLHGAQSTTPVAIMTSAAKGNHWRVKQAFEAAGWFGRGRQAFKCAGARAACRAAAAQGRHFCLLPACLPACSGSAKLRHACQK